ncbi:enolase C-terminal domain-like protein [Acidicapsa ligni]|uniref:enolase C-terminal domain-like protein n=1 Tax=Acidicapsa ligni TaxID=542300 RepID=UPI0021E06653|nr:enolase C-terminal domain-like protein [Acidicapsa ligni]
MMIRQGTARAYTIPTDAPEADGTIAWNSTTIIVVELHAEDAIGLGYTYGHKSAATIARELIEKHCLGNDSFNTNAMFEAMRSSQRNYGSEGNGATALSAVDIALWDLKAKLLDQPLATLLGPIRQSAPVYGSGGFTTYTDSRLARQLLGWVEEGIYQVKMKVGTDPNIDPRRIEVARKAIGGKAKLFIDANGAYSRKQALYFADLARAEYDVIWFEEPVSSDDLEGLRLLRDRSPAGMEIAAGEYGWNARYLKKMMEAGAVDVIQADATRCGGVTGFMEVAAIADAHPLPLSAHCGPTIHMHLACAARPLRHVEYFHDHVRIESMLFDGFQFAQKDGCMHPDWDRPGIGIDFKRKDAEKYADKDGQ